jgi:hypothetical protein
MPRYSRGNAERLALAAVVVAIGSLVVSLFALFK